MAEEGSRVIHARFPGQEKKGIVVRCLVLSEMGGWWKAAGNMVVSYSIFSEEKKDDGIHSAVHRRHCSAPR